MNKLSKWFEEVFAPNAAAARKKLDEAYKAARDTEATGGSIIRPVLVGKPEYDSATDQWTIESSQELAVGDEVTLLRGDDTIAIATIMIRARITEVLTTTSSKGNFIYAIDIFFREQTNDSNTSTEGPTVP